MSGTALARALRGRWSEELADLVLPVRTWLTGTGEQPEGLDVVDGRVDLRGFPLAVGRRVVAVGSPAVAAREGGRAWEGLDLRWADLGHVALFGAVVRDCRFDRADLRAVNVWGCEVRDCSLGGADLRGAGFGTGNPVHGVTTWERVDFSRAKLDKASAAGAEFRRCRFENAAGVVFQACDFADVSWHGAARRIIVDQRGLKFPGSARRVGLDLSDVCAKDFTVEGGDVGALVAPKDGSLWVVERFVDRFGEVVSRFKGSSDPRDEAMVRFARMYLASPGHGEGRSDLCLSWPPDASLEVALTRLRDVLDT